jgi:type IV pilus assembly protein PilM
MGLVGIDLGSRAIKLLQLRRLGRGLEVVGAGRVEVSGPPADAGQRQRLAEQLREVLGAGGFTGRRCVVCLQRGDVRMQSVRLPAMPEAELRQAAVWEASQRFGVDRTEMEVDLVRTGAELHGSDGRQEVLLIGAAHAAIEAWAEPILDAGLRPMAIETHFAALARAFGRSPRVVGARPEAVAVVDVGASGATVLIVRGGDIAFCKSITVGGRHFDLAVAEHLQMDLDAARELRAARIAAATSQPGARPVADPSIDRAVYDAVRPLFSSFAKEVVLCLSYYGVAFRGHPPQKLVLTGGDGLEPRLAEALGTHCKIQVEPDDAASPAGPLMGRIREIVGEGAGPSAAWSVAAGASLRTGRTRRAARPPALVRSAA